MLYEKPYPYPMDAFAYIPEHHIGITYSGKAT